MAFWLSGMRLRLFCLMQYNITKFTFKWTIISTRIVQASLVWGKVAQCVGAKCISETPV